MNYMIDAATHTTLQNEKEKRELQQNDICQSHTLNTCRIKHATFTRFHPLPPHTPHQQTTKHNKKPNKRGKEEKENMKRVPHDPHTNPMIIRESSAVHMRGGSSKSRDRGRGGRVV
jgi:hypothetical protein